MQSLFGSSDGNLLLGITLTFVQHDEIIPWTPVGHPTNISPYLLAVATKFTAPVNVPSCAVKILSRP